MLSVLPPQKRGPELQAGKSRLNTGESPSTATECFCYYSLDSRSLSLVTSAQNSHMKKVSVRATLD